MPETLIKIRHLSKQYQMASDIVHALRNVALDIYDGEYLSIMGPSGSGKSTLFNMIGALDRPSSGEIKVTDLDLTTLSRRQLAYFRGQHIGYIFQAYNLIASHVAIENGQRVRHPHLAPCGCFSKPKLMLRRFVRSELAV